MRDDTCVCTVHHGTVGRCFISNIVLTHFHSLSLSLSLIHTQTEHMELQWNSFTGAVSAATCQLPAATMVFVSDCLPNPEYTIVVPPTTQAPVSTQIPVNGTAAPTPSPTLAPTLADGALTTTNADGAELSCDCCSNCCLQNATGNFCI